MANRIFLFVISLVFLATGGSAFGQSNSKHEATLNTAIERAQEYLFSEETDVDIQSQFLYQHVQRTFGLKPVSNIALSEVVGEEHLFYPFLRLVENESPLVDKAVFSKAGSSIDRVTLKSIYCDQFPLETTFLDTLMLASKKGKYALTHALWSLQLLQENGCLNSFDGNKLVTDQIAQAVAEMINNSSFKNDICIEGMCFLYGIGRADLIDPVWVNVMIGHQGADGGFFRTAKNSLTNSKTTVLALWCMLEFQSKGLKRGCWICRN